MSVSSGSRHGPAQDGGHVPRERPSIPERLHKVVSQKSIPAQICQLIFDMENKLTDVYGK